jgi:hypothetical protein
MSSSSPASPSSPSSTKEPRNNTNTNTNTNTNNKKWLMDRINGQSKYNDMERPPNPCCWVSPIVGYFPFIFETNLCCRCFGLIGFGSSGSSSGNSGSSNNSSNNGPNSSSSSSGNSGNNSKNELFRFYILHFGFICNIIALLMISYTALSISFEYFLFNKSSFYEINIIENEFNFNNNNNNDGDVSPVITTTMNTIHLGLSGIGIQNQQIVIGYNDICNSDNVSLLDRFFLNTNDDSDSNCDDWVSCYKYFSTNCIISILIGITLFFPTFFMTQIRMYSGYDINCVKNTLSLTNIIIVLLNLNIILSSFFLCFRSTTFYQNADEVVYYDRFGNVSSIQPSTDDTSYYIEIYYEWKWSWGLIMLVTGTSLKFIDLLCNIVVSTPTITRDKKEQEIYEYI